MSAEKYPIILLHQMEAIVFFLFYVCVLDNNLTLKDLSVVIRNHA